jgi:hypothetical protein
LFGQRSVLKAMLQEAACCWKPCQTKGSLAMRAWSVRIRMIGKADGCEIGELTTMPEDAQKCLGIFNKITAGTI